MHAASTAKNLPVSRALPIIAAAAFLMLLPFFWFGIPSGHDFEIHFNSWLEVLGQWRQGVIFPHWSAYSHFGYGEARFIFYPPASWTLGAALGAVLPWKFVTFAYDWIALTLAGTTMFLLARRWLAPRDAIFAAVFYAVNPYFWVVVYWRSAMAELLAASYFPLLLLYALQLDEESGYVVAPLGLITAAAWLTNIPSAVMMIYSLGLVVLWIAISHRTWKPVLYAAASVALGIALAAVYLLTVWHEHRWVALDQVLSFGVRPAENFLFIVTADHAHDLFNHIVSIVAVCEIAILAFSLWIVRRRGVKKLWWPLTMLGSMCALLMLKFTLPLWNDTPELRYVQFPWRWLLVMNVVLAFALALALRRWWWRVAVCAIALSPVAVAWHNMQSPWWDQTADIQEMVDNQQDGIGNEGVDEYVPIAADSTNIDQNARLAAYVGNGSAKIAIEKWQAESRALRADATAPGNLALRLFNYPSWKVSVNGHEAQTQTLERTGQMLIPISAGENRVEIHFIEGWDRKVGGMVSICALAIAALLFVKRSHHEQLSPATSAQRSN